LAGRAVYCCGLRVTASAPSEPKLAWYLRRSLDNPRLLLQWFSTDKVVLGPTTSSRPTSLRCKHSTCRSVSYFVQYVHTTPSSINQSIAQNDGHRSRGRCRSPFKPKSVVTRRSAAALLLLPLNCVCPWLHRHLRLACLCRWLAVASPPPPPRLPPTHTHTWGPDELPMAAGPSEMLATARIGVSHHGAGVPLQYPCLSSIRSTCHRRRAAQQAL